MLVLEKKILSLQPKIVHNTIKNNNQNGICANINQKKQQYGRLSGGK